MAQKRLLWRAWSSPAVVRRALGFVSWRFWEGMERGVKGRIYSAQVSVSLPSFADPVSS